MDLLIKNGTIITAESTFKADIAVKNGKITMIGASIKPSKDTEVVDAKGKYVLPGAVDVHTHLALPFGGTVSADDYFAGTRAAACGGTTTVFDFAIQNAGETMPETVKRRDALCAPDAAVDYSFHVGVTDISDNKLDTMLDSVKMGVPSFKVFMTYSFGISDGEFYQALEKAKQYGALIQVHAENDQMINLLRDKFLSEGKTDAWYHYLSRPEFVEGEACERAIQWAKNTGAPLYIVHLACEQGLEAVLKARNEGYPIFAETCPQYLLFTRDVYKRPDARNFVCSPPMKAKESQDALWHGINVGSISTVATDHCPFQSHEKDWGKDDFSKIPNGCMGVENMYPYMLSEANKGRLTFNKVVELCATNPAKLFGCAPQKGALQVGSDADIVIYDPKQEFTISQKNMHSDIDHTIWEGVKLKGYPVRTYSRGNLVYKDGEFLGKRGEGKFVKCKPIRLKGPSL